MDLNRMDAMTGLDTNVLVRYVVQDDPKQSAKATLLIESLSNDAPGGVIIPCHPPYLLG